MPSGVPDLSIPEFEKYLEGRNAVVLQDMIRGLGWPEERASEILGSRLLVALKWRSAGGEDNARLYCRPEIIRRGRPRKVKADKEESEELFLGTFLERIERHVSGRQEVTVYGMLPELKLGTRDAGAVGRALSSLGWRQYRTADGNRKRVWIRGPKPVGRVLPPKERFISIVKEYAADKQEIICATAASELGLPPGMATSIGRALATLGWFKYRPAHGVRKRVWIPRRVRKAELAEIEARKYPALVGFRKTLVNRGLRTPKINPSAGIDRV